MKRLFEVNDQYSLINAWTAWSKKFKALRFTVPWFWGTVGVEIDFKRGQLHRISAYNESRLAPKGFTNYKLPPCTCDQHRDPQCPKHSYLLGVENRDLETVT